MIGRGEGNLKKRFMLIVLVLVAVFVGESYRMSTASAATKPIKLRMMMGSEPTWQGISYVYSSGSPEAAPIVINIMEPLIAYTKDGPVPRLATRWEHSADLTRWRFYLRKGVKFHNGADFTARDVVEFVKWNLDLKDMSHVFQFVRVKNAVAVDDYTVDLIFAEPQPLFYITQRLLLIPPLAISRDNREMAKTQVVGTGPYRFVEWKRGQYIKLAKFEGYWGPKPQIDDVEITFRPEEGVRLAALQAGEVDWVHALGPESARHAPKIVRMPSPETDWLRFDEYIQRERTGKDPIFADKRLRMAVDYAIDRQALVTLFSGFATPSQGQFASPGDFGFNPNLKSRPYDLKKARDLVKEAGAVGKTLTFVSSAGHKVKDRELAEAIINMIEKTGLKVTPIIVPFSEWRKYLGTQGEDRQWMSDITTNSSEHLLEAESRYRLIFVEGGRQMAINDPEATRLYREEQAETDYDKRSEKLAKAWAYAYEQAHYVPLFKKEWIWGVAKNLEWRIDMAGRPFFADMRFTD